MDERTIQVEVNGETLEVTYDREALGRAYAETAQGFAFGTSKGPISPDVLAKSRATVAALAEVIKSWDLVEDDGHTPIPPSTEILNMLPITVLGMLERAIDRDAFGGS